MITNIDKLFKVLAEFLDDDIDMDLPYLKKGKNMYTKRDLISELEKRSPTGELLVNDMLRLALDLTARAKEKTKNFEAPTQEEKNGEEIADLGNS